jgi:hypothetical protein
VVLLVDHAGRDAPALTDRQAVLLRPGPDVTAALTISRGPPGPTALRPPRLPGVLNIRRELLLPGRDVAGKRDCQRALGDRGEIKPAGPNRSASRREPRRATSPARSGKAGQARQYARGTAFGRHGKEPVNGYWDR